VTQDFYSTLNAVKKVLAADFACEESDFETPGVTVRLAEELPGRRRFPFREKAFSVVSMGRGVVVTCSEPRLEWAKTILSKLSRDDIFGAFAVSVMEAFVKPDGQYIAGPDLKFICSPDIFRPFAPDSGIKINLVEDVNALGLYGDKRFLNSLGYGSNPERLRNIAAVAKFNGEMAGIAAACADSDAMWQIGVDTLEPYRNRGIGKATVSAVTEYVLKKSNIPYYSTFEDNIASRALAGSLGFKTAWIELYAREKKA